MSVEKRYADFLFFKKVVAFWIENNDICHRKEWPIRRAGGSKTIYFFPKCYFTSVTIETKWWSTHFKRYVLPHICGAGVNMPKLSWFLYLNLFGKGQCFHRIVSQPSSPETLKTVCVNYSAQHFVTTSRSVDGRRDGSGPKALIAVAQKNAIMRAVV